MGEPSASNTDKLRNQIQRFRGRLRSSFPFISGVLAAFLALFLYNFLFPGTRQLTEEQVNNAIVSVLASATPRPAYSTTIAPITTGQGKSVTTGHHPRTVAPPVGPL